ncbi:MAG: hypothetical protein F4Y44_00960 [Chloroflexi bacterium]|nr:hypothetical protein [Chloroflexota bacterium]
MNALIRVVGVLLLLTAAFVAIYFVVDQLDILPSLWNALNYPMALAILLGIAFTQIRKRKLESDGLDRILTRQYIETNILAYGFIIIALLFFWNWFHELTESDAEGSTLRSLTWVAVDVAFPLLAASLGSRLLRGDSDK